MVATGDWITPQFSLGVPFWGKPPLSFWFTAAGFRVLGLHEWAGRLPSFLMNLFMVAMVWRLAARRKGQLFARTAALILSSCLLFWIAGGAVMTDSTLGCATTLCMVSFWRAMDTGTAPGRVWGYLFFAGLAMGLLAKGPVALVLIGFPLALWTVACGRVRQVLQALPWLKGTVLTLVLALPWYVAAEWKTPGFLEYFLVGEHWNRFLVPGWKGDLYGSAHARPRGTIWIYWLGAAFPWSFIVPGMLAKNPTGITGALKSGKGWYSYLILWSVTPMLLFTLAGNILPAYVLPGLPAFALLGAEVLKKGKGAVAPRPILLGAGFMLVLSMVATLVAATGFGPGQRSQKQLVRTVAPLVHGNGGRLTYLFKKPFSADFYSRGTAGRLDSVAGLDSLLNDAARDVVAVRKKYLHRIPGPVLARFIKGEEINGYLLLMEKAESHREEPDFRPVI
ncbi:MAG: glycosyltransferase family 39 protein [Desulfobacteraceae bacterium]|nr:glycosyltransferase family 39 protein [Desulfobacteraceae bacterium]